MGISTDRRQRTLFPSGSPSPVSLIERLRLVGLIVVKEDWFNRDEALSESEVERLLYLADY